MIRSFCTKKAFIFDWSGTLNDNFNAYCQVCNLIFRHLGREGITPEEIKRTFTLPYMKFWNYHFPDLSKEDQDELYDKYVHQVDTLNLFPETREILQFLNEKGFAQFIVSSDPEEKLLPEIKQTELTSYFIDVAAKVHEKGPVIASFVQKYQLDPVRTFYIGDSAGDVEAGKFAQVKTIGITTGFQSSEGLAAAEPDHLIDDLLEIKNIV
ncbi:MAG: HAD family hydrolase [Patescibacteria group bacterium]